MARTYEERKKAFYDLDAKTMLQATKVERVLKKLGWDPEKFRKEYLDDDTRADAELISRLTTEERSAIRKWLARKNRRMAELAEGLGVTVTTARAKLGKYHEEA